jgi:hypothetical protein
VVPAWALPVPVSDSYIGVNWSFAYGNAGLSSASTGQLLPTSPGHALTGAGVG